MVTATMTVVIADDHVVTRQGIRTLLEMLDEVDVLGEAGTGTQAVSLCEQLRPSVLFLDMHMPEMGGLEAIDRIARSCPDTRILVLTVEEDEDVILKALAAGASGYLSKASSADDLERALHESQPGDVYMSPTIARKVIASASGGRNGRDAPGAITSRERQVLRLLGTGLTAYSIAMRLGISERTVQTHVGHVYRRLGVNNRVDAVLAGIRLGLVEPPRSVHASP